MTKFSPANYPDFAEALNGKETRDERREAIFEYFDVKDVVAELTAKMEARKKARKTLPRPLSRRGKQARHSLDYGGTLS